MIFLFNVLVRDVIYGIQKRAPYKVFRKQITKRELETGRKMYEFILRKVADNDLLGPGLQI